MCKINTPFRTVSTLIWVVSLFAIVIVTSSFYLSCESSGSGGANIGTEGHLWIHIRPVGRFGTPNPCSFTTGYGTNDPATFTVVVQSSAYYYTYENLSVDASGMIHVKVPGGMFRVAVTMYGPCSYCCTSPTGWITSFGKLIKVCNSGPPDFFTSCRPVFASIHDYDHVYTDFATTYFMQWVECAHDCS